MKARRERNEKRTEGKGHHAKNISRSARPAGKVWTKAPPNALRPAPCAMRSRYLSTSPYAPPS